MSTTNDTQKRQLRQSETLLLRECLYALQGMDGDHIRFVENDDKFLWCDLPTITATSCSDPTLVASSKLGNGAQDAMQRCGQAGWYYRKIQHYITTSTTTSSSILVQSSSCHDNSIARAWAEAMSLHLNRFHHSLLADWEAQLQQEQKQQQQDDDVPISSSDLTLRRLLVRLVEPMSQLRTLALIVDGVGHHFTGGPLLTALHRHSRHGDTRHSTLSHRMLEAASRPWYQALHVWTVQGLLVTTEFFVQRIPLHNTTTRNTNTTRSSTDVWHGTFRLAYDQVPEILPPHLVQPCFNVGKGINFIRYCLMDPGWKINLGDEDHDQHHEHDYDYDDHQGDAIELLGFKYASDTVLTQTMKHAEQQVNQHIVSSLRDKHHLVQHLRGLKQFLLFGQGDFASVMMEGLHAKFDRKGIIGLYDYDLMGIIEGALKCTNAADIPSYVVGCLSVKLILDKDDDVRYQFAPAKGVEDMETRTGWDIFTLDYRIPDPLAPILHERAMNQYQLVFSMLLGLKRVEFMLKRTWRQSTALHHAIQIYAQYNAIQMTTNTEYAQTTVLLRHISMVRQAMMHFVVNLKSYLFFEVLEGAWKTLSTHLETGSSLDDFIVAHDAYLADIVQKSLLGNSDNDDSVTEALGLQLQTLLALSLEFCNFQETLFRIAIQQAETATKKLKEAERRSKQGDWGFTSEKDVKEAKTFFGLTDPTKMGHVVAIGTEFNQTMGHLLTSIQEISHGKSTASIWSPTSSDSVSYSVQRDQFNHESLNSLAFQMDYNSFYNVGNTRDYR